MAYTYFIDGRGFRRFVDMLFIQRTFENKQPVLFYSVYIFRDCRRFVFRFKKGFADRSIADLFIYFGAFSVRLSYYPEQAEQPCHYVYRSFAYYADVYDR